jgi:hypothetical protein
MRPCEGLPNVNSSAPGYCITPFAEMCVFRRRLVTRRLSTPRSSRSRTLYEKLLVYVRVIAAANLLCLARAAYASAGGISVRQPSTTVVTGALSLVAIRRHDQPSLRSRRASSRRNTRWGLPNRFPFALAAFTPARNGTVSSAEGGAPTTLHYSQGRYLCDGEPDNPGSGA